MSKAARKRQHNAKMATKAKAKDAKRALYKSYSEKGQTNKTKRHRKGTQSTGKGQHLIADCGNVGCIRCYPHLNNYRKCNGQYRLPDFPIKLDGLTFAAFVI